MDEREQPNWSAENQPGAAEVSERIRSVLSEAESAANAVRHQAEQQAQARLRAAETESLRIVEDARREAERFLAERIAVVSRVSDDLLRRGQSLVERMDAADEVRGQLASLVLALGDTAARLANEVRAMPGPSSDAATGRVGTPVVEKETEKEKATVAEAEAFSEVEAAAPVEPVPDLEPEPEPDEPPLAEPTPLRPTPPVEDEPPAAAEAEPEPVAEAEAVPVDDLEARLLDTVREAERDRESYDDEPDSIDADAVVVEEEDAAPEDDEEDDTSIGEAARAANAAAVAADVEADTEIDEILELRSEPAAASGPDQALGARLVALQMAVAGGNRGEVEAHLRRAFELSDPSDILDDIFGSGSDADKRVVWPEAAG